MPYRASFYFTDFKTKWGNCHVTKCAESFTCTSIIQVNLMHLRAIDNSQDKYYWHMLLFISSRINACFAGKKKGKINPDYLVNFMVVLFWILTLVHFGRRLLHVISRATCILEKNFFQCLTVKFCWCPCDKMNMLHFSPHCVHYMKLKYIWTITMLFYYYSFCSD